VNPSNADDAYVTLAGFGGGHVFHTTSAGALWTDVSGNLPNVPVNALAVDRNTSPETLYVGTDVGVFASTAGSGTWARVGTGLPKTIVMDVMIDQDAGRLIAATFGRGMWSVPLGGLPTADVAVQESAPTGTVTTGGTITYSIVVTNNGSTGVRPILADDVSQLAKLQSVTPGQGTCVGARPVVCRLGLVAPSGQVSVSLTLKAAAGGTIPNPVRVGGAFIDPTSSNNRVVLNRTATLGSGCTETGTSSGDALYGTPGDDRICGLGGNDLAFPLGGNDVVDGGSGSDWVLLYGSYAPVTVNLSTGTASGEGSDTLTSIEKATGSYGGDHLTGTSGDNYFAPQGGVDTITGGGGFDYLDYETADYGVKVDLSTGTASGGDDADTFTGIHGVIGSGSDDTLKGTSAQDEFWPGLGNDTVIGNGCGGCDDFVLYGDTPASLGGITADLGAGTVSGGAGNDTLMGILGIGGTDVHDVLDGSPGPDGLYGFGGPDTIDAVDGLANDYLDGGTETDTCTADSGDTVVNCP
jgi:hypothetical protein